MTDTRRCTQTRCGYYTQGGCQACKSCKAEPYVITIGCDTCLSCEGEEGELRFGDKKQAEEYQKMIQGLKEKLLERMKNKQQPQVIVIDDSNNADDENENNEFDYERGDENDI
jgi:hypothetical protein